MNKFLILFKHELKMQFPLKPQRGKRFDILGSLLSLLMAILICAVFVTLLSTVVSNYVDVKVNKVADPMQRTKELLNVCYGAVLLILVLAGLESMRKTLTEKKHKSLMLRLPVKHQTIFAAKLATLLIYSYALALILIVTVNLIFYTSVSLSPSFWLLSFLVWLFMPPAAFLFATLLLVPYIKIIDFISNRYALMFVSISSIIVGAFLLYSSFLEAVRSLLETGTIKFLFNEKFITTLQTLLSWTYPANCFACIALAENLLVSLLIVIAVCSVSVFAVYFVSKSLFYATLYKNEAVRRPAKKREQKRKLKPLLALIKKEFISISREPRYLFSYFAVAASMPFMVYCCYTMFESLIENTIGLSVSYPLAILIVLIFSILTNTFCATNITRDGAAAIKNKMFPVKASTILLAKVLLCTVVTSLSIIFSLVFLIFAGLSVPDALICALISIAFSTAQIFIATRMDLNSARLKSTLQEMQGTSNRTIAKVVTMGLLLALIAGILSLVSYIFSLGSSIKFIAELGFTKAHSYLLPAAVSVLYLGAAVAYYGFRIEKSLDDLSL